MYICSIPAEDGVIAVIGLDRQDIIMVQAKGGLNLIDFRVNFKVGMPLPSAIQIVFAETVAEIRTKIADGIPGFNPEKIIHLMGDNTDGDMEP